MKEVKNTIIKTRNDNKIEVKFDFKDRKVTADISNINLGEDETDIDVYDYSEIVEYKQSQYNIPLGYLDDEYIRVAVNDEEKAELEKYGKKIEKEKSKNIEEKMEEKDLKLKVVENERKIGTHRTNYGTEKVKEFINHNNNEEYVTEVEEEKKDGLEADDYEVGEVINVHNEYEGLSSTEEMEKKKEEAIKEAEQKGEKVKFKTESIRCTDPNEECNIDNVYYYIDENGEIKTETHHTW